MANRLVSLMVLGAVAGAFLSLRSRSQRRRAHEAPRSGPEHELLWEGEGGALPATGAQMGPDPVVPQAPQVQGTP